MTPTPEESMFQEAQEAVSAGRLARARELISRLLKLNKERPEYWLWMSAAVETRRERIFCLKEAQRLDPANGLARRGLAMLGEIPLAEDSVRAARAIHPPTPPQASFHWEIEGSGEKAPMPWQAMLALGGGAVLFVGLIGVMIYFLVRPIRPADTGPLYVIPSATAQTGPGSQVEQTPLPPGVTPLALQLKATYTPTALYVDTPHPRNEAYRIALRAYQRGDWNTAIQYFNQMATAEPSSPDVQYYLGETYRAQGNTTKAFQAYNQALALNPNFAPAYLGRARLVVKTPSALGEAQKDLETAVAKDPRYTDAFYELVMLRTQRKEYSAAMALLDSAAKLAPDSAYIAYYRAQIYFAQEKYPLALETVQKALTLDLTLLPAYRLQGQIFLASGQTEKSLEPLKTYAAYMPEDGEALSWLAMAYYQSGEEDQALALLDQALKYNTRLYDGYFVRAQIYMERKDGKNALSDYSSALKLRPESFAASMGVGQAYLLMGYQGDAYMQFERAKALVKTDVEQAQWLYHRAQSLDLLGEKEAALRDWRALLALPEATVQPEWAEKARRRVAELTTGGATGTPGTPGPTFTPSATRWPTQTLKPSLTPQPSATPSPTTGPTATPNPTPTAGQ